MTCHGGQGEWCGTNFENSWERAYVGMCSDSSAIIQFEKAKPKSSFSQEVCWVALDLSKQSIS